MLLSLEMTLPSSAKFSKAYLRILHQVLAHLLARYYLYWWLHSLVRENSYSYWAWVCSWCNSFAFVLNIFFGIPIKSKIEIKKKKEKRKKKKKTSNMITIYAFWDIRFGFESYLYRKTNDEQIYYYNSESVRVKDLNCSSNRIVWLEMIRWYNHAINIFIV